ncbi:MAG: sulfurtransferase-like selenium metabolism protein YedF [Nitrospirae bacterium]|nr:sulfurtransferase-like selenium metabolism protein YedF [Nitrospirota bacterium]
MQIDARGLPCPKPVSLAQDALSEINEGIVEVLVDNEASVKNIIRFAKKEGMAVEALKEDKHWRVKIIKGPMCKVEGQSMTYEESDIKKKEKDIFLVIGTDTLGKDEALGKILMNGFLETIKTTKELPHTIFFINAGVKLTTLDDGAVSLLKEIEQIGVIIYSCGTCLRHYGLEDKLKVGMVGGMYLIVEGMKDFKKVVWI